MSGYGLSASTPFTVVSAVIDTFVVLGSAIIKSGRISQTIPRTGKLINDCDSFSNLAQGASVALVYSSSYQINLMGLDKLHSFDINKYERIRQALVENRLIRRADVYSASLFSRRIFCGCIHDGFCEV